jgi:hypothetical protein
VLRRPVLFAIASALVTAPSSAHAQCIARTGDGVAAGASLVSVGAAGDDNLRTAQDLGRCSTTGALIRSSASLTPDLRGTSALRWRLLTPSVQLTHNSDLPLSLNDGPQWTGRGLTSTVTAGIRAEFGPWAMAFSPQLIHEQNRPFTVIPSTTPGRSSFASPWHGGIESADLPLRFGDEPITSLQPGESWIELRGSHVALGASTDEQWWGPGIRNALLLSNNAPGIPEVYLRSRRPWVTRLGSVDFRWLLGALTESPFFDSTSTNDLRSFSAAAVTLRVAFDTGLTVGVARSVYAPVGSTGALSSHLFDVFRRWNQIPDTAGPVPEHPNDQLLSLFGRWVFPASGLETYAEWTKLFAPGLRELLVAPQLHQGYTLGLQWVNALTATHAFRLQGEATMLEQTPPAFKATTPIFYTSRFVPQGYTQRGQLIGAAIGPGASSQFIGADYLTRQWWGGVFVGRTRTEDEAMYLQPNGGLARHDVTIYSGFRGGIATQRLDWSVEASVGRRLNYLFQTDAFNPGDVPPLNAIDVQNVMLKFTVAPHTYSAP